jgi:two-component system, LytTR family, response regulator
MIKAALIEDEPKSLDILKLMLAEHCSNVKVVATAGTVQEGIEVLQKVTPDLVFLDVSLSEGTAFEILQALPVISFQVIFTTAYKDYALDAIKHSALDYLMKPIDIDELVSAVQKYEDRLSLSVISERIQSLLSKTPSSEVKLALPTQEGLIFVRATDILRCEASGNYTFFFLKDSEKLLVSRSIKEYEETLQSRNFYRIHDSHIVNLAYIRKYVKGRGGYVILDDNSVIDVSVRRKSGFLEAFG